MATLFILLFALPVFFRNRTFRLLGGGREMEELLYSIEGTFALCFFAFWAFLAFFDFSAF